MAAASTSGGPQAERSEEDGVALFPTCRSFDFIIVLVYLGTMRNSPADPPENPSVDAPSAPAAAGAPEKRQHLRFDKVFPVRLESILFGQVSCVARNVSAGGIFLETADLLPLGARVRVCFLTPNESGEIVAIGDVKNHYFINFAHKGVPHSVAGMAVRFLSFEQEGQHILRECLDRFRVLH
jgi:hypothetical protein